MKASFFICSLWLTAMLFANAFAEGNPTALENSRPKWGANGHRVIGHIAQQNLTRKAKKAVGRILGDTTLAMASTWMDEIRSDFSYNRLNTWHYVNMDLDETYEESEKNPKGDVLQAVNDMIKLLKNPDATKDELSFSLKILVHLVGDVHQPLHVGRAGDLGGNRIDVTWFGNETNLHSVWDTRIIESKDLGYTELAAFINHPTKQEVAVWQNSRPEDWVEESHKLVRSVYASAQDGDRLSYKYGYDHFKTVERQLLKAGYRLAAVINDIFG